jgi:hypothetical protein
VVVPRANGERLARFRCLISKGFSGFAIESPDDVQDVHRGEGLEVGLASIGMLVGSKPERLHRRHAQLAGAAHVLEEPVTDEDRLLRGDFQRFERAPEDVRVRLPLADLRRKRARKCSVMSRFSRPIALRPLGGSP